MAKRKTKTQRPVLEIIGWCGAFASLGAYFLVSFGILMPRDISYQLLNLAAGLGLGLICYHQKAYQPLFVNVVWALIALLALITIFFS